MAAFPAIGHDIVAVNVAGQLVVAICCHNIEDWHGWGEGTSSVMQAIGAKVNVTHLRWPPDASEDHYDLAKAMTDVGTIGTTERSEIGVAAATASASGNVFRAIGVGGSVKKRVRAARMAMLCTLAIATSGQATVTEYFRHWVDTAWEAWSAAKRGRPTTSLSTRPAATTSSRPAAATSTSSGPPAAVPPAAARGAPHSPPSPHGRWLWWPDSKGVPPPGTWLATELVEHSNALRTPATPTNRSRKPRRNRSREPRRYRARSRSPRRCVLQERN